MWLLGLAKKVPFSPILFRFTQQVQCVALNCFRTTILSNFLQTNPIEFNGTQRAAPSRTGVKSNASHFRPKPCAQDHSLCYPRDPVLTSQRVCVAWLHWHRFRRAILKNLHPFWKLLLQAVKPNQIKAGRFPAYLVWESRQASFPKPLP